jgi:hypothetical protein
VTLGHDHRSLTGRRLKLSDHRKRRRSAKISSGTPFIHGPNEQRRNGRQEFGWKQRSVMVRLPSHRLHNGKYMFALLSGWDFRSEKHKKASERFQSHLSAKSLIFKDFNIPPLGTTSFLRP